MTNKRKVIIEQRANGVRLPRFSTNKGADGLYQISATDYIDMPDNGLPKYCVLLTGADGREDGALALRENYNDEKVGRFHVLMHREFNHFIGPYAVHTEPIGVCLKLQTANKRLYRAALNRGMELQDRGFGLLEEQTDGFLGEAR